MEGDFTKSGLKRNTASSCDLHCPHPMFYLSGALIVASQSCKLLVCGWGKEGLTLPKSRSRNSNPVSGSE